MGIFPPNPEDERLFAFIRDTAGFLWDEFRKLFLLDKQARKDVLTIVTPAAGWAVYAFASFLEVLGPIVTEGIIKAFTVNRSTWAVALATFSEELTGTKISAEAIAASKAGAPLTEFIRAFSSTIGNLVVDTLAPNRFPTPQVGRENAQALFALATRFGIQGWYAHSIASIFSLGTFRALGDLPEAIERSFGLTRIQRLALKPVVKTAIADPLEEYYNRLYQPKFLTVGEAVEGWEKGFVTDEQYYDTLAARGYNASRAMVLLNLHQKQISVADATRMFRLRMISETKLTEIIRGQGYGEVRAGLVATLVKSEKGEKILDEIAATVRHLWQAGKLTDEELRGALRDAYWTETEISLVLAHENLLRREGKSLTVAEELEAFQHALIDEVQVRASLRRQGYLDTDITLLIGIRTRRLTEAQVVELFIRGQLNRLDAEGRLRRLGYPESEIPLLLALHTRPLTEGQVLDVLAHRQIDAATARRMLLQLGVPEDQVDLLLAFQKRQLSVQDVQAALLRGLFTEAEATSKLLTMGFSSSDAALLITLRFRILSRGEILDGYEAGLLTRGQALRDLEEGGHTAEEADLLLRIVEARMARQGKKTTKRPRP